MYFKNNHYKLQYYQKIHSHIYQKKRIQTHPKQPTKRKIKIQKLLKNKKERLKVLKIVTINRTRKNSSQQILVNLTNNNYLIRHIIVYVSPINNFWIQNFKRTQIGQKIKSEDWLKD